MPSRHLAIFDFDETVVSAGTLPQILKFLPTYRQPPKYDPKQGWIDYVNIIFREVHSMGYSPQTLVKFIRAIPPLPGMAKFIQYLCNSTKPKYDLIMISDCNRYFIKAWLHKHNLLKCFTGIYCNPSEITDSGQLVITPYHCSDCPYSPVNLCKRLIIDEFVRMQRDLRITYDRLIYVGDGKNDFCPLLTLRSCDLLCARKNAWLEKVIEENRKNVDIKAELFYWANGYELIAKVDQQKV